MSEAASEMNALRRECAQAREERAAAQRELQSLRAEQAEIKRKYGADASTVAVATTDGSAPI